MSEPPAFNADPKLYAKMAEPYPTADDASASLKAFFDGVEKLRRKHRIPEVTVVACAYHGDGAAVANLLQRGNTAKSTKLLAWALGKAEAFDIALMRAGNEAMRKGGAAPRSPSGGEP